MKNKHIIDSWNKVEPSAAADARMLGAILAHNQASQIKNDKNEVIRMSKAFAWKRLAPAAACLALAVAAMAVIPRLAARPGPPAPPATQTAEGQVQSIRLPAMLAGQEIEWESGTADGSGGWFVQMANAGEAQLMIPEPGPDASPISFSEMKPGLLDVKLIGVLADGRKITIATQVLWSRQEQDPGMIGAFSVFVEKTADPGDAIAVGATIHDYEITDATGRTTAFHCYIEAIE